MTKKTNYLAALASAAFSCLVAAPASAHTTAQDVIETYANIALAKYEDSLSTAKALGKAVDRLIAEPTATNLILARKAWLASRVPYQQTEVYRFGNVIVDDWEGKVNAWPLDEGLIDYVAEDYGTESEENSLYTANVIANKTLKIGGKDVDATTITKTLLSDVLQEADGAESNVATGYHAIEFLLWGQDLNGTKAGAGNRPATDFDPENCTGGNCERRAQYLNVATKLMIDDLTWMVSQWTADGAARKALMTQDATQSLTAIFTGMGSLSYGELAGERMKLGLLLNDPEEEHDCFADNTHNSHYYDVVGIRNVYLGSYTRIDGSVVQGPSVSDLVKTADYNVDRRLQAALADTLAKFQVLVARAETTEAYDQMLAEGNTEGNATVQTAIDALLAQTKEIERAVAVLNIKTIEFEGSDSLDTPSKVAQ